MQMENRMSKVDFGMVMLSFICSVSNASAYIVIQTFISPPSHAGMTTPEQIYV